MQNINIASLRGAANRYLGQTYCDKRYGGYRLKGTRCYHREHDSELVQEIVATLKRLISQVLIGGKEYGVYLQDFKRNGDFVEICIAPLSYIPHNQRPEQMELKPEPKFHDVELNVLTLNKMYSLAYDQLNMNDISTNLKLMGIIGQSHQVVPECPIMKIWYKLLSVTNLQELLVSAQAQTELMLLYANALNAIEGLTIKTISNSGLVVVVNETVDVDALVEVGAALFVHGFNKHSN